MKRRKKKKRRKRRKKRTLHDRFFLLSSPRSRENFSPPFTPRSSWSLLNPPPQRFHHPNPIGYNGEKPLSLFKACPPSTWEISRRSAQRGAKGKSEKRPSPRYPRLS